jgi:hypothetical protein
VKFSAAIRKILGTGKPDCPKCEGAGARPIVTPLGVVVRPCVCLGSGK